PCPAISRFRPLEGSFRSHGPVPPHNPSADCAEHSLPMGRGRLKDVRGSLRPAPHVLLARTTLQTYFPSPDNFLLQELVRCSPLQMEFQTLSHTAAVVAVAVLDLPHIVRKSTLAGRGQLAEAQRYHGSYEQVFLPGGVG